MSSLERFNIVICAPRGYQFSETFREIGETLQSGLQGLGHDSALTVNRFDYGAVNIVLGGHLLNEEEISRLPASSIIYNFEQVHGASQWIKPLYVDLVGRFPTWDYSERNIAMWRRYCPAARLLYVPLGYVPEMSRISRAKDEDIDVLFYGVINARRAAVLDALVNTGINVVAMTGTFGAERDALIARAKVVLNLHFFETKIFELSRVSYLLSNRKAVVSEMDADTEVEDDIRTAVAGVPYDRLVEKCLELTFDDVERQRLADVGFRIFSQRSEAAILQAALQDAAFPADPLSVELPKCINVGSGKGWDIEALNLDVDPLWMPDIVADLNLPLPLQEPVDLGRFGVRVLPAGYFDEIRASHVLEHIPKLVVAMESFLRLLREGGALVVEVPYDLSLGAWQDPTHVRGMNEGSWLYYTDWFWYLGWREHRFVTEELQYVLSTFGQQLMASGKNGEEITRIPRAVEAMRVRLRKVALSDAERQRATQRWLA